MNKKTVVDYITIETNYQKPTFNFPDMSSPQGNPYEFWPMINSELIKLGFKKEAELFSNRLGFMKYSFEEIINLVSFHFDLTSKEEKIKEDDEFVYLKIKKSCYDTSFNLKQPLLFKIKDWKTINELIINNEDLSIKNCYGRTILHYLDKTSVLKKLINENEKNNWINIFHIDSFNGNILHTHNDLDNFFIILNAMYDKNPKLANEFLFQENILKEVPYKRIELYLDKHLAKEEDFLKNFSNPDFLNNFVSYLKTLKKVAPDFHYNIINFFDTNPLMLSHQKKYGQDFLKFKTYINLNDTLIEKTVDTKKMKI